MKMMNAASTSNPNFIVNVGEAYPYPSHVIAPNFITMKLGGKDTYNVWETQILCLLTSHQMNGFIDGQFPSPAGIGKGKVGEMQEWTISDSLVKGWILGSLSEGVAKKVVNHLTDKQKKTNFTAKDLWDELQHTYDPSASTSNPDFIVEVGEAYPYPSHVSAANFVTMKLSGKFPRPAENGKGMEEDLDAWIASDSLVKGWILGSLSDGVAKKVVNRLKPKQKKTDFTAKDLWDELQSSYGPSVREQAVAETELTPRQADSVIEEISESEDAKSKDKPAAEIPEKEKKNENVAEWLRNWIYIDILNENTRLIDIIKTKNINPWDKITNNGNTILHVAVSSSTKNHDLLKELLAMTKPEEHTLLDLINSDGSTVLHVAAIGGNTEAVNILVERNPELSLAKDKEGHTPLALSVSNMHNETSKCLFEHMKEKEYNASFSGNSGEELVVLAISCYDFSLASKIIRKYPDAIISDSDAVLTTLAQNFPRELDFWERREDFMEEVEERIQPYQHRLARVEEYFNGAFWSRLLVMPLWISIIGFYATGTALCRLLRAIAHPFLKFDTSQIYKDATSLLLNICSNILDKPAANSITYYQYYNNSIFEATRQNSPTFIRTIMRCFPDAIWSTNEDGHNFIQYSVINRSEKIYNLLYEMSEHKNIYKTIKDHSGNNLLHLAARLAPTNNLNLISGAALQIQRELQWFKEVERFICPLNRKQKNSDDETPAMVFTREHRDLVIEGENWIKKFGVSYTITPALIITIVFAAAITVPGGNNQESGIPIFTNNIAFTIFFISDAISLFTGTTSLMMFLSVLPARFAEQDFLFKLPMKLIIGLTMLLVSTTTMIIAFGATLFLVFGQGNLLMLIPIGALTCLPITYLVTLHCPLIVELIIATYGGGIFDMYGYLNIY